MREHEGEEEERSPDEPLGQPPHVDSPTESDHLESPEPGHPAGETEPADEPEGAHEHPEDVGETPSDEEGGEDVTQSPGSPADEGPD